MQMHIYYLDVIMQSNVLYNKAIEELSFKEFGRSQYTLVEMIHLIDRIKKDFDCFNYPNCYYPYCLLSRIQGFLYPN